MSLVSDTSEENSRDVPVCCIRFRCGESKRCISSFSCRLLYLNLELLYQIASFVFVDVSRRLCELQPALVEVEQQLWRLLPQRGVVDVHLLPHEGDR